MIHLANISGEVQILREGQRIYRPKQARYRGKHHVYRCLAPLEILFFMTHDLQSVII